MRFPLLLVTGLMLMATSSAVAADAFERELAALIDRYELPWMPSERPLNGVRIAVDAAGGGQPAAQTRQEDDLALMVVQHLYHLIDASRGKVILTRKGDHPFSVLGPADIEARANYILERKPQIVLTIAGRCLEGAGSVVSDSMSLGSCGEPVSKALVDALVKRPEAKAGVLANILPGVAIRVQSAGVPVVSVLVTQPCQDEPWTKTPDTFRVAAKQIYDALVKVSQQYDLVAAAQELSKDEREAVSRRTSVWPEEVDLPLDRVDWFVRQFAARSVSTRSLTLFTPRAEVREDTVVITGSTNFPRLLTALERALAAVGVKKVDNQMRVLPDEDVLGDKLYGVCVVPQVLTYANQGTRTSLQSQLLYGEPVMLMDKQGDEYLVHGGDGYWGWVIASAIRPIDGPTHARYLELAQVAVTDEMTLEGERIPAGALLPVVAKDAETYTVLLANGAQTQVSSDAALKIDEAALAQGRVQRALEFLHTPYVFGGRSPLGMDCSGLVTNVYSQIGEVPARDAWQQAMAGKLVATAWSRENIRAGDLLFYINRNGRIYHTGVALSPTHVIHASDPCVRINSAKRGDRLFEERLERDFFMAKRP